MATRNRRLFQPHRLAEALVAAALCAASAPLPILAAPGTGQEASQGNLPQGDARHVDQRRLAVDALLPPPAPPSAAPILYLDVSLNRTPRGLLPFSQSGGRLQASPEVLRSLGLYANAQSPVYLHQIPGAVLRYDARLQTLALEVPLDQLSLPTTVLSRPPATAATPSSAPGALINYELYGSRVDGLNSLSLSSAMRLFGIGSGSLENSFISRRYQQAGDRRWRSESVRLDSRWRLDFPDRALTLEAGDFYSGFVDWTRTLRMGGVQIGRNFELQPYRVLTPGPTFLGEAVVPSTVELYVDGLRQYSGQVPAGPFQLAAQPGINGTGAAQVVLTDAFGRTQTVDFSFYGTQQLLAKGISNWSLGIGRLRRNYGQRSFDYDGRTVANASWRGGISDHFTGEAHAEGGGGLALAGAGGGWLLGGAGVVNVAYARSRYQSLHGGQLAVGYSWNNRRFNVNLRSVRSHGHYRDLGALQGNLPPSIITQATVGLDLMPFGSLSASYLRLRYPRGDDNRYASLFWSRSFSQRCSAYLSANQNLDRSEDRSLYLSLTTRLGREYAGAPQLSLAAQRNGGRQAWVTDISRPPPGDGSAGGIGWRAQARRSEGQLGGLAEVGILNDIGRYALGAARQGGMTYAYGNASGSLVWMDGHGFATREVTDAFAVVSTRGVGGVPVRLENRLIGSTDEHGLLLVTPLRSWQRNRISIDTLQLPADTRADRVEDWVTPRQRAGTVLTFDVRARHPVYLIVQDSAGQPLPAGSQVQLPAGRQTMVGYDGLLYLEDVPAGSVLQITTGAGKCRLQISEATRMAGGSATPRPLRCRAGAAR